MRELRRRAMASLPCLPPAWPGSYVGSHGHRRAAAEGRSPSTRLTPASSRRTPTPRRSFYLVPAATMARRVEDGCGWLHRPEERGRGRKLAPKRRNSRWMRRISPRILELLVGGESGAMRGERWGKVLAVVVLRMGRKPWASWDLHLPPSFPLCLAVVVPGGGGERRRRRPDRPHPLLYFP
jgi:hypothetical protein